MVPQLRHPLLRFHPAILGLLVPADWPPGVYAIFEADHAAACSAGVVGLVISTALNLTGGALCLTKAG